MRVRWGFIGAGDVTRWKAHPREAFSTGGSRVIAVARSSLATAHSYAEEHGIDRAYESVEALLGDPDVDAVYICTPHNLHAANAVAAIRAGKHVLCEKPMANSTEECLSIVREAHRFGVTLGVAFYRRFYPIVERVRQIVVEGGLGTVTSVHAIHRGLFLPSGQEMHSVPRTAWRTALGSAGGGVLNEAGSHRLDLFLYLFGPARSVTAHLDRIEAEYEGEDQARVTLRFKGPTVAHLDASWCSRVPRDSLWIGGTQGELLVEDLEGTDIRLVDEEGARVIRVVPRAEAPHRPVAEDMTEAIASKRSPRCPGLDGARVTQLVGLAYSAASEGRALDVTALNA